MTVSSLPAVAEAGARRDPHRFLGLALGSIGVVYGDIGTSPLYAFRESIAHLRSPAGAVAGADVIGVISLMLWALMLIVTVKYVLIVMRFDNKGEGGILSLMALVQRAGARGAGWVLVIGMLGAGLFLGDAVLTPAVSVLSAVEGLTVVKGLGGRLDALVVPISLAVLAALFLVQRHGTGGIGRWFGPVCGVWFATIAVLGLHQIVRAPGVLAALNPAWGARVLATHLGLSAALLSSVFLTVTGAEALYADMGHFGRRAIRTMWLSLVFPCLTLNYLGQGALVLAHPAAAANPFFLMAPDWFQLPLVAIATAATVIASQAVISGAFSIAQQAIQLDLLPRMSLLATSEDNAGQIYAPQVNWLLMIAVAALVIGFHSSSALASAYGISVVGAMVTTSVLAVVAIHRLLKKPLWLSLAAFSPILIVEGVFVIANLSKLAHGGYVPLLIAAVMIAIMWSWVRGTAELRRAQRRDSLQVSEVLAMLADRPPMRAKGTAVFLTGDPATAPTSLLHNLKHNQVLHEQLILLTVRFVRRPRVREAERVSVRELSKGVKSLVLTYGFMERPNVALGLRLARAHGVKFDIMATSFFLGRRTIISRQKAGLSRLRDLLFIFLSRNSMRTADFFQIPPSRVIELGAQVSI